MAREAITITTRGIKDFERYIAEFPDRTREAAKLALNDTTRWARTRSSEEMRRQIAFPKQYLDSATDGRLYVSQYASGNNLETRIRGKRRVTSLARFLVGKPDFVMGQRGPKKRSNLKVRVKPGRTRSLRGAFAMKLRVGDKDIDTAFNVGIALRLPKGVSPPKKRNPKPMKNQSSSKTDLYLLYAPSVDQVFQDVAKQFQEPAARKLETEFLRQFNRLGG